MRQANNQRPQTMNIQSITEDGLYYYEQVYKSDELVVNIITKADKLQVAEVHPEEIRTANPDRFGFRVLKPYLSHNEFIAIGQAMQLLKRSYVKPINPENNGSKN